MSTTDSALVAHFVPNLTPRSSPEFDSDCAAAAEIQNQLPIVRSSSIRNSCWQLLPCESRSLCSSPTPNFPRIPSRSRFRAGVRNSTPTAPPRLRFRGSFQSCVQARFGILVGYRFHMSPGFRTMPDSETQSDELRTLLT